MIWSEIAQTTFVRGAYRRLCVGPYRVLYEVEGDLITIVRVDQV